MKNLPLLIVTVIGTLALIIGIAVAFSSSATETQIVDQAQLIGDARLAKGPAEAKVTIVEFSDLQCPACRAVQPLLAQILAEYPDDVRLVYRHFPLISIHANAQPAAQASEVALAEGKFWEFHDLLFERQLEWEALSNDEVKQKFGDYAAELGIDKESFIARIESEAARSAVSQDVGLANQLRVDSTPTFFLNGQKVAAPQQLPTLVEQALTSTE
ncbi:MAG: DsbA family protein [bacterium]|nr:DsbA family protein [bacterium]